MDSTKVQALSSGASMSSYDPNHILVSDVFHTGSPDSTLWEFKHGNGNFKRGDLIGLREIKRRASRHALIHRDSFPTTHKPSVSQPGTPAEPMPEVGDVRLTNIEHSLYDMHARLVRTEESNTALSTKCQALTDSLINCHQVCCLKFIVVLLAANPCQWSHDVSQYIIAMIPDHESQLHRDGKLFEHHRLSKSLLTACSGNNAKGYLDATRYDP